jgi:hypothetical protein
MIRPLRLLLCAMLLMPTAADAQTSSGGLGTLLPDLILRGVTLPGGADPGSPHAGHFTLLDPTRGSQPSSITSPEGIAAAGAVLAFNDRLRSQLANFPLGSSSGGFTYTYDSTLGTYTRRTDSFGPAFAERAATIGRGRRSFGFNFQHTSFDSFGGENLKDGSITFYLPHTDCCAAPAAPPPSPLFPGFEGDLLETAVHMQATTDTLALLGNFGVTDRFDLGIAIPLTRVDLETTVEATILRLATATAGTVHTFTQGQDDIHETFSAAGTATGIGDIVLRSKYNFLGNGVTGLAAGVDVRLPTGDDEDLLGLGTTQAKFTLIMSGGTNRFAPHVNIGYTVSGSGDRSEVAGTGFRSLGVSDEFNYAGGVEFVASPQLTLVADVVGRTLMDAGTVEAQTKTYDYRVQGAALGSPLQTSSTNPVTNQPYRQLTLTGGNLNLVLGTVGAKFNPFPNVLVAGHVLFPLTEGGLRDRLTIAFGFDFAF